MTRRPWAPWVARWLRGLLLGATVAIVLTAVVAILEPYVPVLNLLVLYLLAVLPVAVRWGAGPAAAVAVLSTMAFVYLFVPPRRAWAVAEVRHSAAVVVFIVTAITVGNLAARLRRAAQESARLSREQAALRRVATLVAKEEPAAVFEAVTREVGELCGADLARMERYDFDGAVTGVATWSRVPAARLAVGTRFKLEGTSVARQVRLTGGPVRVDSFTGASGAIADESRRLGIRSSVGCPIVVDGELWGVIAASSKRDMPFAAGTETQITRFTELVATAVGNAHARAEIDRLLEEQAALYRVAARVARETLPVEVFGTVIEEINRVFGAGRSLMIRLGTNGAGTIVALAGDDPDGAAVGARWTPDPHPALAEAVRTGRPVRRDYPGAVPAEQAEAMRRTGIRSSVAMPILVRGTVWGGLGIDTREERFPPDAERCLAGFAELVATAIANADARRKLRRLAADQAALRRVATLAARGAEPDRVFAAVAEEVSRLFSAQFTGILRFETDGTAALVGGRGWSDGAGHATGSRSPAALPAVVAAVRDSGRSVRRDANGGSRAAGAEPRIRSAVASPIVVEGRLWGTIGVASATGALPADTEQRLADFTEIVAIAIANTESRVELAASRARVIAAGDAIRRRVERDLHDGAQQRLVALALELRHTEQAVPAELSGVRAAVARVARELTEALDELRELSRGIHPAILSEGGLGPALRTLARRAGVPVDLQILTGKRFPEPVEVAAYYVVSEAITNTAKHAGATHAEVIVEQTGTELRLSVRDDGSGGADPQRGTGLTGLRDRVEGIGGSIRISSPVGAGTSLEVSLPLPAT